MDSKSEDLLTLSKLKVKVDATRSMLNRHLNGAPIAPEIWSDSDSSVDELSYEEKMERTKKMIERMGLEDMQKLDNFVEEIETQISRINDEASPLEPEQVEANLEKVESEMGETQLVGLVDCLQVQVSKEENGDDISTNETEITDFVGEEGTNEVPDLANELLTEIKRFKGANPIANVSYKDLEEANESKFGKPIAETKCMKGVRQNDSVEQTLKNGEFPKVNGPISYLKATKNELGGNGVANLSCKSTMALEYTPYTRVEGVPSIEINPDPKAMDRWSKCLVGYFLGAKLPFHVVKREVLKKWNKEGMSKMTLTDSGFFLFEFESVNARDKILEHGLIHIFGRVMVLKKWHLMMSLSKEACGKIPIWVTFHNLPFEYWTANGLGKIASIIGRPLYADQATEHALRISYARVCIEVEAKDERVDRINLVNGSQSIEIGVRYQWFPSRCGDCKVFGHTINSCPAKPKEPIKVSLGREETLGTQKHKHPNKEGGWKEVRGGRRNLSPRPSSSNKVHLSNSFDIMKSCKELDLDIATGLKERGPECSKEFAGHKERQVMESSSQSCGLIGSDDTFGKLEKKKTENSKLKDSKGNVLSLKEVKNLKSDSKGIKTTALSEVNMKLEGRLDEAVGSPVHNGLSFSDYPKEWPKSKIKKAIKATKLAGPQKMREYPP